MKIGKDDKRNILRVTLAVSLMLAVTFTVYSGLAYTREQTTTRVSYETKYVETGKLTHVGFFGNETVYKNGTGLEYYPKKITRYIKGNYLYSTRPEVSGHYRLTLNEKYYITSGKDVVYIVNLSQPIGEGKFSGTFSVPVTFNLTEMDETLKRIRDGTGLYRAEAEVYLQVEIATEGRQDFSQKISLSNDKSGMLKLQDTEKEYKKVERHTNTTINTINFLGKDVKVSTGRTVFPIMALGFVMPPVGFMYTHRRKTPPDELKGLRKFIVEGVPKDTDETNIVTLASARDLEKTFDLLDKPILHYRHHKNDVYTIVEGDVTYEYIKPSKERDGAN
ncbi:DUF5305 family protein [Thermococcus sp. MAR1]|uniref:DUF5305 family protein n=1 Tax=Thermococcus sp. MAR1 TaxID=1638263 RepID=UPI0016926523|nr:DUF5305 family protein [Thermococcus sp. MAR1]NJE11212.1 hypothetical protein [Thermococcus sp. MAR1]